MYWYSYAVKLRNQTFFMNSVHGVLVCIVHYMYVRYIMVNFLIKIIDLFN